MTKEEIIGILQDCGCESCLETIKFINRLQAENENYSHNVKKLASSIREYQISLQAMRNSANSFKNKYKSAVDTAKELQTVIKEKDATIEMLEEMVGEDE